MKLIVRRVRCGRAAASPPPSAVSRQPCLCPTSACYLPTSLVRPSPLLAGSERQDDDWLERHPGVPFTPYYLNPLLAAAWEEFVEKGAAP
eukprot:4448770-Prymnesium_polylepis.1